MKVLVTGVAGFIGMHLAQRLLSADATVVGIDNFDPYYDISLKRDRLGEVQSHPRFHFEQLDLSDAASTLDLFSREGFTHVAHLAAQPGVRYSLINPKAYIVNNIDAFANVLEACRDYPVEHLVYASSSSVYGATHFLPFSEDQNVDHPLSLYAATKKANELLAHSYSHLYRLPSTGLRFFTVYGPWGRPDMAPILFAKAIVGGKPINVFNHGAMERDFTYIDDITEGVARALSQPPAPSDISGAPFAIYNVGNHRPVPIEVFIGELERLLGRKAIKNYVPMQPGDVRVTFASNERFAAATGFSPSTELSVGLSRFVEWFVEYYGESGPMTSA